MVLIYKNSIKVWTHILEAASKLQGDIILDGELYRENTDFQDIMKAIKKYRKGISESIKFYCYDTILMYLFLKD